MHMGGGWVDHILLSLVYFIGMSVFINKQRINKQEDSHFHEHFHHSAPKRADWSQVLLGQKVPDIPTLIVTKCFFGWV